MTENPHGLDYEVTLLVVPTDGIQATTIGMAQAALRNWRWNPEVDGSVPIAVTNERELGFAKHILTDEIWIKVDDFQRRRCSPILSDRRRASPKPRSTRRR